MMYVRNRRSGGKAFYGRVLHIIVQTAKMRVFSFFFGRLPRNLVGLEDPICDPFI